MSFKKTSAKNVAFDTSSGTDVMILKIFPQNCRRKNGGFDSKQS
jgi:hypothetical protein